MQKAYLKNLDTGRTIHVMFNPNEFSISKSNLWFDQKTIGKNQPDTVFISGQPATMTVRLFFDTYDEKMDVRYHTDKIAKLMEVSVREEGERNKLRPPKVIFGWGLIWTFTSVITQVNQRYTLFLPTGTPVRATVDVTLRQFESERFGNQNPTSGGGGGRRTHLVAAGETLDLIAFQELGDARLWRRLAEVNGITDPLNLVPGSVLAVQPEN
jgi:nucleoid-associated protein YgaU